MWREESGAFVKGFRSKDGENQVRSPGDFVRAFAMRCEKSDAFVKGFSFER